LAAAPAAEWEVRLNRAGVPAGRVLSVPQALAEPQIAARRMMVRFDDVPGTDRPVTVVRGGFLVDGEAPQPPLPPPRLGEHDAEIFTPAPTRRTGSQRS
jgi:CoA:oxalate CoA-transferase